MKKTVSSILGFIVSSVCMAEALPLGDLGQGVTAKETAPGKGYILYSPESLRSRFTLFHSQASQFAAVYYTNGTWYYYNNETPIAFTPESTDVLVAEVDYPTDIVNLLDGQNTITNGIQRGYADGDLAVVANRYAGVVNRGEFEVTGTEINLFTEEPTPFDEEWYLGSGVTAKETASGRGYILYSPESLRSRFTLFHSQASQFAAVYYANGTWYYYNNETPIAFTPESTDVLVAVVDYTADTVNLLDGQNTITNGIQRGYADGDLAVVANRYAGVVNPGEFEVTGTEINLFTEEPTPFDEGWYLGSGVTAKETASGKGYILYSPESLRSRFTLFHSQASQFVAVYYANEKWYYYNNETPIEFTPESTDVLVAEVDYTADTSNLLNGQNTVTNGIQTGYFDGDLTVTVNRYGGVVNPGEFELGGTHINLVADEPALVPNWWTERGIIDEAAVQQNNNAVANLGQAKWMVLGCHAALDSVINLDVGFTLDTLIEAKPTDADTEWYEEQRKVLNIGQLKHLSAPFYNRLNELAPQWVETQMQLNGISWTSGQIYPWNESTPVEENYGLANIGQLKSLFSLRFNYDSDGDGNSDLNEYIFINQDPDDEFNDLGDVIVIPNNDNGFVDSDGDGLDDAWELENFGSLDQDGSTDHDEDGLLNSNEFAQGRNPSLQDHPAVGLELNN